MTMTPDEIVSHLRHISDPKNETHFGPGVQDTCRDALFLIGTLKAEGRVGEIEILKKGIEERDEAIRRCEITVVSQESQIGKLQDSLRQWTEEVDRRDGQLSTMRETLEGSDKANKEHSDRISELATVCEEYEAVIRVLIKTCGTLMLKVEGKA